MQSPHLAHNSSQKKRMSVCSIVLECFENKSFNCDLGMLDSMQLIGMCVLVQYERQLAEYQEKTSRLQRRLTQAEQRATTAAQQVWYCDATLT